MKPARTIELLSPARDLDCGRAAVDHGADAVYIGAPRFGARAAATNSLDDLHALADYAHQYRVRIYATVNTILKDNELEDVRRLIQSLYDIGIDALIVQDIGITRLGIPPIPLHASTQMDNRTVERVHFLSQAGFRQVVLARELGLQEIRRIHDACPDVSLEVFVHGALCVSYSGQCYVSQACYGRSANRGECAQFCRMAFDVQDADGRCIQRGKHPLSLKDMNRLDMLEPLLDAGASSLKIEGRLKDLAYVKNITSAYRLRLDEIMRRRPEYVRPSSGTSTLAFTPQPDKSFSRGFTGYYLDGTRQPVDSPDTPKSLGEEMGTMKEYRSGAIVVSGIKPFHNGDGVCYLDDKGHLQGFRINRVEGNKLYPAGRLPAIRPRTTLYRNQDQEFDKLLSRPSAERRIGVQWQLQEVPFGFSLTLHDEDGNHVTKAFPHPHETARTPQAQNIETQLSKLGGTPFQTTEPADIRLTGNWFIPASVLSDWRRQLVEGLIRVRRITYRRELAVWRPTRHPYPQTSLTYLGNVMNREAKAFYVEHGVQHIDPAYELQPVPDAPLMFCKHCIKYSLGLCQRHGGTKSAFREPFYLVSTDGRRFRLEFDCRNCQMLLYAARG